jgi:hypothetical protein
MTRSGLAHRTAMFVVMIVAGYFLGTYLDQRYAARDIEPAVVSHDSSQMDRPACGSRPAEPARKRALNNGSPALPNDDG